MKILILGNQGTIGRPLTQELIKRGHDVYGADLMHCGEEKYKRCDIRYFKQVQELFKNDFDVCYLLSAEFGRINSDDHYENVWETNVIGTRNILEIQREKKFKLIFASSSEIYGELNVPFLNEDMVTVMQKNDYAISKWVNEIQCKNFREKYGNEILVLRFFNAYGEGELYNDYRSVCALFCYRALHGIPYEVYEGYKRVFMWIYDFIPTLANACDKFVNGETINIGGEEYRSVHELSDIVLKESGKTDDLVKYLPEDKHNVVCKRTDISKACKLLGHKPKVILEDGIKLNIQWMREIYKNTIHK